MVWLEEIRMAVSQGIVASFTEFKDTLMIFASDFLSQTVTSICDILCVGIIGYVFYVYVKVILGDEEMYSKLFDKTFISIIGYMILRLASAVYFTTGGMMLK